MTPEHCPWKRYNWIAVLHCGAPDPPFHWLSARANLNLSLTSCSYLQPLLSLHVSFSSRLLFFINRIQRPLWSSFPSAWSSSFIFHRGSPALPALCVGGRSVPDTSTDPGAAPSLKTSERTDEQPPMINGQRRSWDSIEPEDDHLYCKRSVTLVGVGPLICLLLIIFARSVLVFLKLPCFYFRCPAAAALPGSPHHRQPAAEEAEASRIPVGSLEHATSCRGEALLRLKVNLASSVLIKRQFGA